ncbi:NUDIX domain-containing protein [Micromonospora sp. NBC_01796]|uniref:NUDIX domain-containing protein n=1 Tax=Micromonospora sp. NBC_01796 TaxID=2975987 RepID=UPI002DD7B6F2|nr:NUDIX domain-containing protein [Micromonospora sp. NBC_01796]WSA82923.1 NUDIX domain-containing protein [Micromonospora sp. NBC_01796]
MSLRAYGTDASFCPRCGAPLPGAPPTACGSCGYNLFVNARPTASLIVLDGDPVTPRFLALRRAAEPRSGLWETPGGFCDGWEHPATAAVREGREELGVEVKLGDYVGMYVGSYDYQGETLPVLDVFYLATIDADAIRLDPAESSEMTWFDLADPPTLAFETMDQAVRAAARQLGC